MKETKNNIQELQELLSKKKENMKKSINSFQRYKELSDSGLVFYKIYSIIK